MRKFVFELEIWEGNDDFWEGYNANTGKRRGYATCEEVEQNVEECLGMFAMIRNQDYALILRKFTNDEPNLPINEDDD